MKVLSIMNKYTLITGASEGIGLEMAKLFARDKHNLILVSRNEVKLNNIKQRFEKKYGICVKILSLDFSVDNSCMELYRFVDENNLIVDNLINNVGIGSYGEFINSSEGFEDYIININIRTVTILSKLFLKEMKDRGEGRILNVASTAAFIGGPKMAIYYATKAYVLSLTEALFEEGKAYGVLVSCLCPGAINTGFQEKAGIKKTESSKKLIMNSRTVAEIAYRDFNKGKAIIIPGYINKILVTLTKFLPRSISRRIVLKSNKN